MNYKNIDAVEFSRLMEQENTEIIDVRSPMELAEGSIPGHKMINMFDPGFMNSISQLDKDKTYLVYCRSGNRSSTACGVMSNLGFKNIYNLSGGIGAWNALKVA